MLKLTLFSIICIVAIKSEDIQNNLTENKNVKTESVGTPYGVHIAGFFNTADGKDQKGESVALEPIFGRKRSTFGNKDSQKWGISCNDSNTCKLVSDEEHTDFYKSMMYRYKFAKLFLRLEDQIVNIDKVDALPVELVTGGNHWPLEKFGILGLSPRGDAAEYFRKLYNNDTSLLFRYKSRDNSASDDKIDFETRIILNPQFKKEDELVSFDFDDKAQYWSFQGSFNIENTSINTNTQKICFSNSDNNLIITNDNFNQCEELQKLACGGKFGSGCNRGIADLTKLKNLSIKLGETEVVFTPEEYLFFDENDVLSCRIGDPGEMRILDFCDKNTEFAVGKLFYDKYYPVLTFKKNSSASFTLLKSFNFPSTSDTNFWLIFIWILAVVLILAVIALVVYLRKKSSNDKDENYKKIPID
jgi:hypothetical protein